MCDNEPQNGEVPVDVFSEQQIENTKRILKRDGVWMVSIYFSKAERTPVKTSEMEQHYKISMSSKEAGFIFDDIRKVWRSNLEEKKCDKDFSDDLVEKWENYYRFLRGGGISTSTDVDPAN